MVPFRLNPAQRLYWAKRTRRNLILKARQKGISKVIDADQLVDCVSRPIVSVVISHEKGATQRLFAAVRRFVDSLAVKPTMSIDSKSEIKFPKRGSSYFIGTAGQKAFGRGDTVDRAHLSEAAHYGPGQLSRILAGIGEAAEHGEIDVETTANGREEFYDLWQDAKAGRSSFTPIFIPWFVDEEYSVDNMTEKERGGLSAAVRAMFDVPDAEFMAGLDKDELLLIARVKAEWGVELTAGMMKWRRYKVWDRGPLFPQEYPEDDVSCFLQTGRSVFAKITVDVTRRIPLDNFDAWAAAKGWDEARVKAFVSHRMYAAVDGAEGTPGGDRHVFAVIDHPADAEQGAAVWEYASNEPIDVFWSRVKPVCDRFNLRLAIEKNGLGVAHVRHARRIGVRFEEWTTGTNRPAMITELEEAWRKETLIETYPEAEDEARNMLYGEKDRADAPAGKHDDRVFARAIALQMMKKPRASVDFM